MTLELQQLYEDLKKVRAYLIKIGPSRREGNILQVKLNESKELFNCYSNWLVNFRDEVSQGKIESKDIPFYENYCKNFESLYSSILQLCQLESVENESSAKMNTFDLKTALTLLTVMSDDEISTKQLIDNINYYDSLLTKPECKKNLVKFVLKSRLSQAAKLRLKDDYSSVTELISDMNKELLPKKGATAIQNKLQKMRQNEMSISEYGKEITELFVDLTISQANGNAECYNILKTINEKQAIKQFSDGLRNRRLSTIISARNYSSLKDAIQAAQDEDTSGSTTGEVMGMYKKNFYSSRSFHNNSRYPRGGRNIHMSSYRGQHNAFQVNSQRTSSWNPSNSRSQGQRGQGRGQRGRYNRGTFNRYHGNRGMRNNTVNVINQNYDVTSDEPKLDEFFRE